MPQLDFFILSSQSVFLFFFFFLYLFFMKYLLPYFFIYFKIRFNIYSFFSKRFASLSVSSNYLIFHFMKLVYPTIKLVSFLYQKFAFFLFSRNIYLLLRVLRIFGMSSIRLNK